MELKLNEAQTRAYVNLSKFLDNGNAHNFLLLGPAGSGKTTVIVNAFNGRNVRIAFCAFTNKATQVLCRIADKFSIDFTADFMTVHKLLALELKYYSRSDDQISFTFKPAKIDYLADYDYIIFDECSTISSQLYAYLREAAEYIKAKHDVSLKFIFLGDYWQLPPIDEGASVVFKHAVQDKWQISKLDKVMRSANDTMLQININMLAWIPKFKHDDTADFVTKFPYNLVDKSVGNYLKLDAFLNKYVETLRSNLTDCIILTYARKNCDKLNNLVQDIIDTRANREIRETREDITFYVADRCCIDKPIELCASQPQPSQPNTRQPNAIQPNDSLISHNTYELGDPLNVTLYNGEIFDIVEVEDIYCITNLNKFSYIPPKFNAQRIKLARINNSLECFWVIHVKASQVIAAKEIIKINENRRVYLQALADFSKKYPVLNYGYCMTIYKSQGSEYHTVFVNLNSIKWSIVGKPLDANTKTKVDLFRSTYTALSRSSSMIYCFW